MAPLEPTTIAHTPNPINAFLAYPEQTASPPAFRWPTLVLTPGAGGRLSDSQRALATAFRTPVLVFEGTMNLAARVRQFRSAASKYGSRWIGGHSMGSRAACTLAAEIIKEKATGSALQPVERLVLTSYPLVAGQGDTKAHEREGLLLALPPDNLRVLLVVGDRDAMAPLGRLDGVRARMAAPSWRIVVRGAGHGLQKGKEPKGAMDVLAGVIGEWLRDLDVSEERREGSISWGEDGSVVWSGWVESTGEAGQAVEESHRPAVARKSGKSKAASVSKQKTSKPASTAGKKRKAAESTPTRRSTRLKRST